MQSSFQQIETLLHVSGEIGYIGMRGCAHYIWIINPHRAIKVEPVGIASD